MATTGKIEIGQELVDDVSNKALERLSKDHVLGGLARACLQERKLAAEAIKRELEMGERVRELEAEVAELKAQLAPVGNIEICDGAGSSGDPGVSVDAPEPTSGTVPAAGISGAPDGAQESDE